MKATVNLEVETEELKSFAADLIAKGVLRTLGSAGPDQLQQMLAVFQQSMGAVLSQMPSIHSHPPRGVYPPGYGPQPMPPSAQQYVPSPNNVRPIQEAPEASLIVDRCFPIEESRQVEAGVCCCRCGSCNSLSRSECRCCGHTLCHVRPVVTPPPAPDTAPPTTNSP